MKIFYIDESGTGLGSMKTPYFTFGAFVIDTSSWVDFDNEVCRLKKTMYPIMKPEDFELKGRNFWAADDIFNGKTWEERLDVLKKIAMLVKQISCRIFVVSIDKQIMRKQISEEEQIYRIGFWQLLDVLNAYLVEEESQGLLLLDSRSTQKSSVQDNRTVSYYRDWSKERSSLFVELPLFGNSKVHAGLQLADILEYFVDFEQREKAFKPNLKANFDKVISNDNVEEMLNILKSKNFDKIKNYLSNEALFALKNVIDKRPIDDIISLIEKKNFQDLAKLLTTSASRDARSNDVIKVLDIIRDKISFSKTP